jgi:2-pyrone-4,6-dicarboxylate lactonase
MAPDISTPDIPGPEKVTRTPTRTAPPKACDAHMHIFGPADKFPYAGDRDYTPPDALTADYLAMRSAIGFQRTVVVQPSVYGVFNACSIDAVRQFGADGRGVAVIDDRVSDAEIDEMNAVGFRGARLNIVNRGISDPRVLEKLAARVAKWNWHVQIFTTPDILPDLVTRIKTLPVPVVIDHIGKIDAAAGLDQDAVRALLDHVSSGGWAKLSGAYRVVDTGAPWAVAAPIARALIKAAPERLVWGTDWPHPSLGASPVPNDCDLIDALYDWTPDDDIIQQVLVTNPASLYDFD